MAFTSALKRIAPGSEIRAVTSLPDAEAAVREWKPELLVFDFDPPYRNAVAFFNRLKPVAPDSRVLILGVGVPKELANEPAAFRFLEKPFQLEEFGSIIHSLLGNDRGRRAGRLRDLNLVDVISLYAVAGASTVLSVEGSGRDSGEIHFGSEGIAHAAVLGHSGAAALKEMLRWKSPRLRETERISGSPRTIRGPWSGILLDALHSASAQREIISEAMTAEGPSSPVLAGKKIVIVDDTEMLLIFLVEILSTLDRTLQVATASLGWKGLEQIAAVKPDLVLLDYSLPDITGAEVCERLLKDTKTAGIPVVMMSGHVAEMMTAAERYSNVIATIGKPFLSTSLLELVQKTMEDLPKLRRAKPTRTNGSSTGARGAKRAKEEAAPASEETTPPSTPEPPELAPEPESNPGEEPRAESQLSALPASSIPVGAPFPGVARAAERTSERETTPVAVGEASLIWQAHEEEAKLVPEARYSSLSISGLTSAGIPNATSNAVVLSLPLEVLSIELTGTLRMSAIRARPLGPVVSVHVLPQALPGFTPPEAGFELAQVNLDTRGQIDLVHLAPTSHRIAKSEAQLAYPVGAVAIVSGREGRALQLTPAAIAPMRMQLLALFELVGVRLSSSFGLDHLVLKARGSSMRLSFSRDAAESGATFSTAQVLLDRSAHIAEILLDSFA